MTHTPAHEAFRLIKCWVAIFSEQVFLSCQLLPSFCSNMVPGRSLGSIVVIQISLSSLRVTNNTWNWGKSMCPNTCPGLGPSWKITTVFSHAHLGLENSRYWLCLSVLDLILWLTSVARCHYSCKVVRWVFLLGLLILLCKPLLIRHFFKKVIECIEVIKSFLSQPEPLSSFLK